MKSNIQIFKNSRFGEVRVTEIDGKPYFMGSDVAKSLGYSNTNDAIIRHCKSDGVVIREVIGSIGRKQDAKFLNEGNLYRLAAKSELPGAEEFESWIFDEILPSIRRTGGYIAAKADDTPEEIMARAGDSASYA
jgi:prophage antirepressor-like protein